MNSKKLITRIILLCLVFVFAFSFAGCKDENEELPEEHPNLPDQYENYRYYVQQGYRGDSWTVSDGQDRYYKVDSEGKYADGTDFPPYIERCGLVATFTPKNVTNVKYNIYTLEGSFMRATQGDMLMGILGKSSTYNFEFNNLFLDDLDRTPRDNFVLTDGGDSVEDTLESIRTTTVEYNKISFQRISYSFTVDGNEWQGMLLLTLAQQGGFHVITLETEASVWDANFAAMEEMLSDFRLLGWETDDKD